jgi:hypothetical protein
MNTQLNRDRAAVATPSNVAANEPQSRIVTALFYDRSNAERAYGAVLARLAGQDRADRHRLGRGTERAVGGRRQVGVGSGCGGLNRGFGRTPAGHRFAVRMIATPARMIAAAITSWAVRTSPANSTPIAIAIGGLT